MSELPLAGIDVAILCGGLGTRLRAVVNDLPKPLAPVGGRPFVFYLLDLLALRGARQVTLCCGYKSELIREQVGSSWLGMPVTYTIERELLGTGGALALAKQHLRSDWVLVLNGDSIAIPDFDGLRRAAEGWEACLVLAEVPDTSRYGAVDMDASGSVQAFREKATSAGKGWINAGIYLLRKEVVVQIPDGSSSLERDCFPELVRHGRMAAFRCSAPFVDIGVPEDYFNAAQILGSLGLTVHPMFPDNLPARNVRVKFGVCIAMVDNEGRWLMERRADCGRWGLPGGKMDPGETVIECAHREAKEETGLEIDIVRLIAIFSDPRRRTVRYLDNGDVRQLVDATVEAKVVGGDLKMSDESLELRWFSPAEFPLDTIPPAIEILRSAGNTRRQPLEQLR